MPWSGVLTKSSHSSMPTVGGDLGALGLELVRRGGHFARVCANHPSTSTAGKASKQATGTTGTRTLPVIACVSLALCKPSLCKLAFPRHRLCSREQSLSSSYLELSIIVTIDDASTFVNA